MNLKYKKLKTLLKELFQLDQPDLDFGLYRIMRAKNEEVSKFLDEDLLPQVKEAFNQYRTADKAEIEKQLNKVIAGVEAAGMDPDESPIVKDLRAQIKNDAVDISALESEVYDHLFSFFRRYYSEGDFLAKRVYKPGVYAVPYEGEEVLLHWANKDQYYIKTSEYLRDYSFRLQPDNEKEPMRVHFRLVDIAEGEHGNIKATGDKKRRFILVASGESGNDFLSCRNDGLGEELVIHFEYRIAAPADWPDEERVSRTRPPDQKDLSTLAAKRILSITDPGWVNWIKELSKIHIMANGESADYSRLEAHFNRYTARNTFDCFIHKNLGAFLRQELDFYIKNEVMHLDDIESESVTRVEQYLSKIRVIRKIAHKIIDFLAQLEDFQKKLWLKKKFIVETQYCISTGSIPEVFYAEIAANQAQQDEWMQLYGIEQIRPETIKSYPTLVVDTRHFNTSFNERLLEVINYSDDQIDGVVFHGENFQALNLMQTRFRRQVQCVYIDPPYNAPNSEIVYKNNYKHSSFLSLIEGRLTLSRPLSSVDGSHVVAIDKHERDGVFRVLSDLFPFHDNVAITVEHNRKGVQADHFSFTHEYALFAVPPTRKLLNHMERPEKEWGLSNFRNWGGESLRTDAANCFYAVLTRNKEIIGFGDVWTNVDQHPSGPNVTRDDGVIEIYPIDSDGIERKWRYERGTVEEIKGKLRVVESHNGTFQVKIAKTADQFKTVWYDPRYNAGDNGTRLVREMGLPIKGFDYPKSIFTTRDCIFAVSDADALVLDYFAGSGTTGHAVIKLNREDGGKRKFLLVEMGDYFETVLLPRIKKVTFAPEWKKGKPERFATEQETKHSPRIIKVIRLESYEDTLNNLRDQRTEKQQLLLDDSEAQGAESLREQYVLRYMLDVETRGSQSLLDVQAFTDPTAYKLRVKQPGSDESREVNVDLLETFNWLIGLTVHRIAAPQTFKGVFKHDSEDRLRMKGGIRQEEDGPYWFRTVTGVLPNGNKTLIIWRKLNGNLEQDNLMLDEWFAKSGFLGEESEFDLIYTNGGNNLENLKAPNDLWKVRLIEEDFHRLMFDTEGV